MEFLPPWCGAISFLEWDLITYRQTRVIKEFLYGHHLQKVGGQIQGFRFYGCFEEKVLVSVRCFRERTEVRNLQTGGAGSQTLLLGPSLGDIFGSPNKPTHRGRQCVLLGFLLCFIFIFFIYCLVGWHSILTVVD